MNTSHRGGQNEAVSQILNKFTSGDTFRQILDWHGKWPYTVSGLNQFGRALLVAALASSGKKPVILITKSDQESYKLQALLANLFNLGSQIYPQLRPDTFNRQEFVSNFHDRTNILERLPKQGSVTIFTGQHLIERLTIPSPAQTLKVGDSGYPQKFINELLAAGYEKQAKTFQPGEIANRGEVLDIFPIGDELPWRVTFGPEKIDSIYSFNPLTGSRVEAKDELEIPALKPDQFAPTLADYLAEHAAGLAVLINSADEIFQSLYEMFVASENLNLVSLDKAMEEIRPVKLEVLPPSSGKVIKCDLQDPPVYASRLDRLVTDVQKYLKEGWQILLATDKDKSLTQVFAEADIAVSHNPSFIPEVGAAGVLSQDLKLAIITSEEIFALATNVATRTSAKQQRVFMAEIVRGDYIVHNDHGIGRLLDIDRITVGGVEREYLILEYAKGDRLYVPVDQIDKISKYISPDGSEPQLSRLSSQVWKKVVAKIKKESHKFAKELLDLYAKRQLKQGISFDADQDWQRALADSFEYKETPDQETVIGEILTDMAKDKPMDRLLVADVGFGKTEVAIRAAFQAVSSGYQVAVLAPTTILVEQHYKTFTERLKSFKTRVAALSRFKSKGEQDDIVAKVKLGEVDIAIGTHRLLSKDIKFKNLGLIIIDEEQRFGVAHKEKLKLLRNEVDVLSLTATPIPRTLNLALSGIRDISVIETAPSTRLPIITSVSPVSNETIRQAVSREIARGGQVYFIHNRVQTIDSTQHKLEQLLPNVRFINAHGQMSERMLAKIMQDFNEHKYDCLIASTIIENGIDNPNVNTLIIDDAGHFGLSQLHQLRGRIGRGKVQAYAYFLYNKGKLSPKGLERLKTIQDNTELGSGYNIAMRDLQIRGAGGVLSKQQHGHIAAIGLSLYTKLINKSIEEMRTGQKIDVSDVTIDLPVSAYLPVKYVDIESQRLKIYQTLGVIENEEELVAEFKRIEEAHGDMPIEVINLRKLLQLKLVALKTQLITTINAKNLHPANVEPKYQIVIGLTTPVTPKMVEPLMRLAPSLEVGEKEVRLPHTDFKKDDWIEALTNFVSAIEKR